ncbi:MAG: ABC transporter substrate-binding protein [Bacteroidales bacterium]|nr:ABC transporter substrate-binding protein [Bacteroidales bacterium]
MYSINKYISKTDSSFCIVARKVACLVLVILFYSSTLAQNFKKEKVVLQLKWKNQFQFAGYYAALEKGYYKETGLNVEIREANESTSTTNEVLNGGAQYGVANSELVVYYMEGKPLVVLACMMQNSPSALLVKSSSNVFVPKDLVGKSVEIDKDKTGIDIFTMLSKEGVNVNQINVKSVTFSLNNLLANKIDALAVYTTNEPFFLDKFGIPYRLIYPRNYGINFYSDCLFTSKEEVDNHPDRVRKFRNASIKGWKYALDHPEEIINIIQSKYQSIKTAEYLLRESEQIRKLINPEFIEVGHSNRERWLDIVEILSQQGFIEHYKDIDEFLYNPYESKEPISKLVLELILVCLVISLGLLIYYIIRLRKSLSANNIELEKFIHQGELQKIELKRLRSEVKRLNDIVNS